MSFFSKTKNVIVCRKAPEAEFELEAIPFFLALLHACPEGSRLSFDQSEPESFVHAFRRWSHRDVSTTFEADWYVIGPDLVAVAEQMSSEGKLELDHHFGIVAPDGHSLCSSLDDFKIVTLADDIRQKIRQETNHAPPSTPSTL